MGERPFSVNSGFCVKTILEVLLNKIDIGSTLVSQSKPETFLMLVAGPRASARKRTTLLRQCWHNT